MQIFTDQFGREFDWGQFAAFLRRVVYNKWGQGLHPDDTADALQEALTDVLEHWLYYASSTNADGTLNLGYALRFATGRFSRYYLREQGVKERAESPLFGILGVEEVEALCWMETLSEGEIQDWFHNLEGSGSTTAAEDGVSRATGKRRRATKRRSMKRSWELYRAHL